jgi:hypothetical protein
MQTRWIAASLRAMNVDNKPQSDFEKHAAKEIAAGKPELEMIDKDYYHRAVAIPLTGGCLSCHEGVFQNNGRKKFAGLVVSIPLREDLNNQRREDH